MWDTLIYIGLLWGSASSISDCIFHFGTEEQEGGGRAGEITKITLYHWIGDLCNILLLTIVGSVTVGGIGSWFSNKCGTTGRWVENDLRDRQTYLNAISL